MTIYEQLRPVRDSALGRGFFLGVGQAGLILLDSQALLAHHSKIQAGPH